MIAMGDQVERKDCRLPPEGLTARRMIAAGIESSGRAAICRRIAHSAPNDRCQRSSVAGQPYLISCTPTALFPVPEPTPAPTVPVAMRWTNFATRHDVAPLPELQIASLLPEM